MILRNVFKYYSNNKAKVFTVFISIALAVFLIYLIEALMGSISSSFYASRIEPRTYYSIIRQKDKYPDESLIENIKNQECVERVIPFIYWTTSIHMIIGGTTATDILQVKDEDMDYLMARMNVRLKEGRKPDQGKREIMIHNLVAANKKLKVGDSFGSAQSKDEWVEGSYKVVGIVEGGPIVSFAPFGILEKEYNMKYEYNYGGLIIHKDGMLDEVNEYLERLPNVYNIVTYKISRKSVEEGTDNMNLLADVISLALIIIVSLCIGFFCYIYSYGRRNEWGLLISLGYSRQDVINQVFLEISGMNVLGYFGGLILVFTVLFVINKIIYIPQGQPLNIIEISFLIKTACVPIFAALFSVIPVWKMLKRLDSISILEGGI